MFLLIRDILVRVDPAPVHFGQEEGPTLDWLTDKHSLTFTPIHNLEPSINLTRNFGECERIKDQTNEFNTFSPSYHLSLHSGPKITSYRRWSRNSCAKIDGKMHWNCPQQKTQNQSQSLQMSGQKDAFLLYMEHPPLSLRHFRYLLIVLCKSLYSGTSVIKHPKSCAIWSLTPKLGTPHVKRKTCHLNHNVSLLSI